MRESEFENEMRSDGEQGGREGGREGGTYRGKGGEEVGKVFIEEFAVFVVVGPQLLQTHVTIPQSHAWKRRRRRRRGGREGGREGLRMGGREGGRGGEVCTYHRHRCPPARLRPAVSVEGACPALPKAPIKI
jgi:hypothetical protein